MKCFQILLIGILLFLSLNTQVRCDEEDVVEEDEDDFEGQEKIPEEIPKQKVNFKKFTFQEYLKFLYIVQINFTKPVLKDSHYLVDYFESNDKFRKS